MLAVVVVMVGVTCDGDAGGDDVVIVVVGVVGALHR